MYQKTDGFVLAEKPISESDRLVTLLTRNSGVLRAFARGTKNSKNKNFCATQLFWYSDFVLFVGKNSSSINEASLKNNFWSIRTDIEKFALTQYFCEIVTLLVGENVDSSEILRLLLNSVYLLDKNAVNVRIIKSVFEMKLLVALGYMPNLIGCSVCGSSDFAQMFFSFKTNNFVCKNCLNGKIFAAKISASLVAALRHCAYSDAARAFSFETSDKNLDLLNKITESCILEHVDKPLFCLDFYKNLVEKL